MNDDLLKALVEDELEDIEAAELWAANDEIFDAEDLLDEPDWQEDAELEN